MGRARVRWNAAKVVAAADAEVTTNADRVGATLARRMRSRAPRSAGSGNLPGGGHAADTATHAVTHEAGDIVRLRVGFSRRAWYMHLLEDGTDRQPARPTVRPVVLESKGEIVSGIARS